MGTYIVERITYNAELQKTGSLVANIRNTLYVIRYTEPTLC